MNRSALIPLVLLAVALPFCKANETVSTAEADFRFARLLNSARQGDVDKQVELADDYLVGYGVKQNAQMAAQWYEKAANAGNPGAQNQIGYLYQSGLGVPKDSQRAAHWYQLSAANGSTSGKVNLAVIYVWGIGVERNPELGASLLKEASAKGNGLAAAYLGDLYLNGVGVPHDMEKAVSCFEKGAKLHSYYAEFKLGVILSKPDNRPEDLPRAVTLLRSSASQGYVPAMYALGLLAVNHPESNIPHQEGLAMLQTASDSGSWKASVVFATLARDGKWVPKSPGDAYRYFRRGLVQGGEAANQLVRNDLHALSALLGEQTIAMLDSEVTGWANNHPVSLELIHKANRKLSPSGEYALISPLPGDHVRGIALSLAN